MNPPVSKNSFEEPGQTAMRRLHLGVSVDAAARLSDILFRVNFSFSVHR